MINKMFRKRCDKFLCFRGAIESTQDIREVQPIYSDGSWWAQWEGLGMRHGCDEHPPKPSRKYRLGDKERLAMIGIDA